jgi:diguanylate cyclase (GGDEF)-like protein/putative nucleotidyltransferase with HDIG domain
LQKYIICDDCWGQKSVDTASGSVGHHANTERSKQSVFEDTSLQTYDEHKGVDKSSNRSWASPSLHPNSKYPLSPPLAQSISKQTSVGLLSKLMLLIKQTRRNISTNIDHVLHPWVSELPQVMSPLQRWLTQWLLQSPETTSKASPISKSRMPSLLQADNILQRDIQLLLAQSGQLSDIWQFLQKRLSVGCTPDVLLLSGLQFTGHNLMGDALEVLFAQVTQSDPDLRTSTRHVDLPGLAPHTGGRSSRRIVSLSDRRNHLVATYLRKDTTFSATTTDLGTDLLETLGLNPTEPLNLFSVPLIAGNRAIALITLGFRDLDHFSRAKVSYVYNLRETLAQLIWNLLLQQHMHQQTQVDNLTGLVNYSCFQQALTLEVTRCQHHGLPLSVLLLDINALAQINAKLGHVAGDTAICHLANTLRRLSSGLSTVARFGPDEVVVLLPEVTIAEAQVLAQDYQLAFENTLPPPLSQLTLSIGLASLGHNVITPPDEFETALGATPLVSDLQGAYTDDKERLMGRVLQALHLAQYQSAKNLQSVLIADTQLESVSDKTWLEIHATQVAHQFPNTKTGIYQELIRILEQKGHLPAATSQLPLPPDVTPNLMLETISSLAGALEAKDRYTRGHSQMVANYAVLLANALNLSPETVENIRLAAFLHDIGKIGIPESILCKQGPLTPEEWDIMKQHPVIGARQILSPVSALKDVIPMVEFHHENWNGGGYPLGLIGDAIPLGARIVSIVDAFHGLTSDRSYRKALPLAEAQSILQEGAGIQWDPHLINVFFKLIQKVMPGQSINAI